MKTSHLFRPAALSAMLVSSLTVPTVIWAQTDNFNSYTTLSGFTTAGWVLSQMAGASVTTTFPAVGNGKGLRFQAKPVAGQAPAVAIWYRTTEYTNFYLAVDVVDWADTNQAIALLARGSIVDDPGGASGYLVNYNVAQGGVTPTSPRQGELAISVLTAPFGVNQLAIGEVTLDPGRPYRFVFTGAGFHFKVQVYDWQDLTQPLIQLEADDVDHTYTNGVSGLMSYSRDDVGVADVTVDNYEIGEFESNPATPPALAHPVPGTPTIETRIPAERFRNCYNRSDGIVFTASTFTADVINSAATKMFLNGTNVSSQLVLSPNGPNLSGSLPGSALKAYTVYSAQIEVQDVTGLKKSTNTFWFDTFSDAYLLSSDVKIIEAEHYNYSNGVYQLDPIAISGLNTNGDPVAPPGIGYADKHGVEGVDYHDSLTLPEPLWAGEFRQFDPVGLSQGIFPEIYDPNSAGELPRYSDRVRNQYATNNMLEFVVHRTKTGEWLNYTRDFDGGIYNAYLRVASLGATTVLLDRVTNNPALPGQSKTNLGKFTIPNQFARYNYRYLPLVDNVGTPLELYLSGITTLRLTMAGTAGQDDNKLAINYLLFAPAPGSIRVWSSATVLGTYTEETTAIVDFGTSTITLPASGSTRFYRLKSVTPLTIRSLSVSGGIVTLTY